MKTTVRWSVTVALVAGWAAASSCAASNSTTTNRWSSTGFWPEDLPITASPVAGRRTLRIDGPGTDDLHGSKTHLDGRSDPRGDQPASEMDPATTVSTAQADLQKKAAILDAGLTACVGLIDDLDRSSSDYLSLVAGSMERGLLRPLLLFLVEKGVLGADEIEDFLTTSDPGQLLGRLRDRLGQVRSRQARLEVERSVLFRQLERLLSAAARTGPVAPAARGEIR